MERKEISTAAPEFSYFEIQAFWGVTKHMGGPEATDELAALCHVDQDKYVLEVGCGVGITACHLVKRYGCRVIGVDLSDKMVAWSTKRAQRRSIEHKCEFRTADAQNLPFEAGLFDAVICESVTAFPQDPERAVSEYVRVTKPGGYVGLNEGTWLKPPPAELVAYVGRTMAQAKFLAPDGWQALLAGVGLTDVVVSTHRLNALSQRLNEMRGLDFQDLLDRLQAWRSFVGLYASNAGFRKYAKEITPSLGVIKSLFTHLGYGIYMGRKQADLNELSTALC